MGVQPPFFQREVPLPEAHIGFTLPYQRFPPRSCQPLESVKEEWYGKFSGGPGRPKLSPPKLSGTRARPQLSVAFPCNRPFGKLSWGGWVGGKFSGNNFIGAGGGEVPPTQRRAVNGAEDRRFAPLPDTPFNQSPRCIRGVNAQCISSLLFMTLR